MKKFLNDLKKELSKLNVSESEIKEIIEDHKQMITTALEEGLDETDIASKFGNPQILASDLANQPKGVKPVSKTVDGYDLLFDKPGKHIVDMTIKLVSEDITIASHDEETFKVYGKNINNIADYEMYFDDDEFELHRTTTRKLNFQEQSDVQLKILLPKEKSFDKAKITMVNGDLKLDSLEAKKLKFKSTNGDSTITNIQATDMKLTSVNGNLKITNIKGESLHITLISGDVFVEEAHLSDDIKISSVSGDGRLLNVESNKAKVRTVSGDIEGTNFYPDTLTAQSVSGDITITNEDKARSIHVKSQKSLSGDVTIS